MVGLDDITVGHVSGMIAAAIYVVQLFIPFALPVILIGLLREKQKSITTTAVTWSVVGRFLHNSYWPTVLFTDSAASSGVSLRVQVVTWGSVLCTVLLGVAAVVTPLGLYEGISPSDEQTVEQFHYVRDVGPFGQGTPPRGDIPWSRICGGFSPYPCPHSNSNMTFFSNDTGDFVHVEYFDSRIPDNVTSLFQSGLRAFSRSVSSIFDIQWRSYTFTATDDRESGIVIDNGTSYPVGSYLQIDSLVLNEGVQLVEGLIVDMRDGGIGFRNHSAPPASELGSSWSEDILFIEPESVCVDTNLTLDFEIPAGLSQLTSSSQFANLVLTDRGGFSNLVQEYPQSDIQNDSQNNPQLWFRAYKAAWINNAWSMFFMNVTNAADPDDPESRAFEYLDSEVGKRFPLMWPNSTTAPLIIRPNMLQISSLFGSYLDGTDLGTPSSDDSLFNFTSDLNISTPATPPLYENPNEVGISNFSSAGLLCEGVGGQDYANITNFAASCGMMFGAPRRQDGDDRLIFEPGTNWTIPIYTCITTTKALVKSVTFRFNGTDDLSGLSVTNVTNKVYPDEDSKPLWAVEYTESPISDVSPIWGLVSAEDVEGVANISTLRKESLYLPGYSGLSSGPSQHGYQNLPGVDFHVQALAAAYTVYTTPGIGLTDYSGQISLALFRMWQDLSRSPSKAALILNRIWTDIATNAVVGTRGMTSPGSSSNADALALSDDTSQSTSTSDGTAAAALPVTTYRRRIMYRYAYGVPAFILLFITLAVLVLTAVSLVFTRAGPGKMRKYLNETSAGRLLTAGLLDDPLAAKDRLRSGKDWIAAVGRTPVTLGNGAKGAAVPATFDGAAGASPQNGLTRQELENDPFLMSNEGASGLPVSPGLQTSPRPSPGPMTMAANEGFSGQGVGFAGGQGAVYYR
ncbi:hypothetical protein BDY21DRAFT_348618 [Lineolata rhizophorae]|uniref:Uncharacterized protein n=1 Tax=Lineolata rhizophorae TaxID=578093 RepID=A0A6A6NVK6_9PEZI|nr:hypothetical protein BDY21DRAFT_348618 [Lineolata rhizophorae]